MRVKWRKFPPESNEINAFTTNPTQTHEEQATKEIGRELKKVKAFLLQRLVKRCRRLRGGGKKGGGEEESRWVCMDARSTVVVVGRIDRKSVV